MQKHTITSTHGETPFATVQLKPNDIHPRDLAFLKQWAKKLGVSDEVLLKRMLIAAVERQQYAEQMPEI